MSEERSQEGIESPERPPTGLTPKEDLFAESSEKSSEEHVVDFHWSKRRHRIRQLVKEFSEQTHSNY